MMEITAGKLKITLREPDALEAVPFVPLFARYIDRLNEVQQLLSNAADDEQAAVNRERVMLSFFATLDKFTKLELNKYMATLIEKWTLEEEPTPEAVAKLPPFVYLLLFDAAAVLTLFGKENNLVFFEESSTDSNETTKQD